MKGSPEVIAALNECLRYFHTSFVTIGINTAFCKKWGYGDVCELLNKLYKRDVENCEILIDRIIFLDGLPSFEKLNELPPVSETVEEMFIVAKNMSMLHVAYLSSCVDISAQFKDFGTRNLVENMLVEEEKHLVHIEAKMIQFSERGKA